MATALVVDALDSTSPATVTAGADAQLIGANQTRNGLTITVDPAATVNVYLLLRSGVASATNFDIPLTPGGSWDGRIGDSTYRGAVRSFSSGTPKVGVVEV